MSFEKWEAYLVHARHCYEDCQSECISAQNAVFLALTAGELIMKTLYYKHIPEGHVEGHLDRRLSGTICHQLNIRPPQDIVEAIRRVEGHYKASRYPEETTKYFCCLAEQAACQHYPEALSSILADVDIIYSWAEELIFHSSPNSEV